MAKYYNINGNIEVWETKPEGYYTVEEWQELHPAPPAPEPTTEEKIAALDAQYNRDKSAISEQYTAAIMVDDTELADELKSELITLNADYDEKYREIVGEE